MSGVWNEDYDKKYYYTTPMCSGPFLNLNVQESGISWDHGYIERVMCEFCDTIFYVDKEVSKCPSCGASHYKKKMF